MNPDEPQLARLVAGIPYAAYLGIKIASRNDGRHYQLPFRADLVGNPRLPAVHGGALAAFMENAAILELLIMEDINRIPNPVDFSIDYLRSAGPHTCHASAEVLKLGRRVAQVQVFAWQNESDKPIATARVHFLMQDNGGNSSQTETEQDWRN